MVLSCGDGGVYPGAINSAGQKLRGGVSHNSLWGIVSGRIVASGTAIAALLCAGSVMAQNFPTRFIEVIVPTPAGASTDTVIRMISAELGAALGVPLTVTNYAGSDGIVGTERLVRAKPDGYTVGVVNSAHPSLPFLYAGFKHDPVNDFTPICMIGRSPILALVNASFPAANLKEFVAKVRAEPGKHNYAVHSGQINLDFGSMAKLGKLDMVAVQYRGGAQAITALIANEVQLMATGVLTAKPQTDSGRLRAIAISSGEKFPGLAYVDQLPLMSDEIAGYRGSSAWWGLIGPPGMPEAVTRRLTAACETAVRSESVGKRLKEQYILPANGGAQEIRDRLVADIENTRKQVEQTGVKPQ